MKVPTLEVRRQFVHIIVGVLIVALYHFSFITKWHMFYILIGGISISLASKKYRIPLFAQGLDWFERDDIRKIFPGKGVVFFFAGALLTMELFAKDIALAAIIILALGDSISHIVGRKIGTIKNIFNANSLKLMEGTFAGILCGFFGALLFVHPVLAAAGAFCAMIAELIEMRFFGRMLDDNLLIPLVAGTVMHVIRLLV
jgi:dolichol kinase